MLSWYVVVLFQIAIVVALVLLGDVLWQVYRWVRSLLGDAEPEAIPCARVTHGGAHPGYRREPRWLRPLEAAIITLGLTGAAIAALCFLGVAGAMLFV